MIPNNNLSVLPWYTSIEDQNARKWWTYGQVYPLFTPAMFMLPFQIIRPNRSGAGFEFFNVYTKKDVLVGEFAGLINTFITVKSFSDYGYEVIVYPGQVPLFPIFDNGQYYVVASDGFDIWYSEIFTVVNDIEPYLRIQWWDVEDFIMDAGVIVYEVPTGFRNVLYLDAAIAKPEYPFEEEGEIRDGYFFPIKQISEKRYRFKFLASEYLLDVMRFIRMADFATIKYHGQLYNLDTFLITPEWESNGDVASVEAEFDTATVAKKNGKWVRPFESGDFSNAFNNDFNNQ